MTPFVHSNGDLLNDLWLLEGRASDADASPSAGGCGSYDFNLIGLHALFMFLGWGVFLQAGAFIARYFRHVENAWWFKMHRIFQVGVNTLFFFCKEDDVGRSHFVSFEIFSGFAIHWRMP